MPEFYMTFARKIHLPRLLRLWERFINKLQNDIILLMFIVWKIRNIRFVGNIITSTKCEFYFDDVTVTSFIDIKCGDVAIQSIP